MPSDDGIAFYNSQLLTSVTPITDFQRQVESNQQGKRAAKLYQFNATTIDTLRADDLHRDPLDRPGDLAVVPPQRQRRHQHDPAASAASSAGRSPSLVGFNQPKITQMAWENAIGQIRSNVEKEAMEEGLERTQREAATRNAALAQYLIGGDRVALPEHPDRGALAPLAARERPDRRQDRVRQRQGAVRRRRPAAALALPARRGRLGRPAPQLGHGQLLARLHRERRRQGRPEPDGRDPGRRPRARRRGRGRRSPGTSTTRPTSGPSRRRRRRTTRRSPRSA